MQTHQNTLALDFNSNVCVRVPMPLCVCACMCQCRLYERVLGCNVVKPVNRVCCIVFYVLFVYNILCT